MNSTALILCAIAIVVAVILDSKCKLPLGVTCIIAAFLIGYLCLGKSINATLAFFPTSVVFIIALALSFFSIFAANGTTEVLAKRMLNMVKGRMKIFPLVSGIVFIVLNLFVESTAVRFAVGPLIMEMAIAGGADLVLTMLVSNFAAMIGSQNFWVSALGLMKQQQLADMGFTNPNGMLSVMWANAAIGFIVVLVVYYIVRKGYKAPTIDMAQFENVEFSAEQKKSLVLLGVCIAALIVPAVLKNLIPGVFTKKLAAICCIQVVFPLGILAAVAFKLSNFRDMVKKVNLGLITLVVGVTMLFGIASEAGMQELFTNLAGSLPAWLVPPVLLLISAALSFFASAPALYPVMFPVALALATTDAQILTNFSCVALGLCVSACSPFSANGANVMATVPPKYQDKMIGPMFKYAIITPLIAALIALVGGFTFLSNIFAGVVR